MDKIEMKAMKQLMVIPQRPIKFMHTGMNV